jgi:hypothetical protein
MDRSYKFSILRLSPGGVRDERINIGAAVFGEKDVDVRLPMRLDKIRVISAALDQTAIRDIAEAIRERDFEILSAGIHDVDARVRAIGAFGPINLSETGTFVCDNKQEYEARIAAIFESVIDPEPAPKTLRSKRSRLLTELKRALRFERVLARRDENLKSHRIVADFELAEGLVADLALKNGVMHIVETVDVSSEAATPRKAVSDIAVSALVLEQARINFGNHGTRTKLVYSAMPAIEAAAQTCLDAAEHQGAELINWASTSDQIKLVGTLAGLATPIETAAERRRRLQRSDWPKLKLA